jgi:hypothetical protein
MNPFVANACLFPATGIFDKIPINVTCWNCRFTFGDIRAATLAEPESAVAKRPAGESAGLLPAAASGLDRKSKPAKQLR